MLLWNRTNRKALRLCLWFCFDEAAFSLRNYRKRHRRFVVITLMSLLLLCMRQYCYAMLMFPFKRSVIMGKWERMMAALWRCLASAASVIKAQHSVQLHTAHISYYSDLRKLINTERLNVIYYTYQIYTKWHCLFKLRWSLHFQRSAPSPAKFNLTENSEEGTAKRMHQPRIKALQINLSN